MRVTYTFSDPSGDNTPKPSSFLYQVPSKYLGKAGDAAAVHFEAHAASTATSSDGFKTQSRVQTIVTAGAEQGKAKVWFKPSGVGGDDFKLKVAALDSNGGELLAKEGDTLTVWRSVTFNNIYEMQGETHLSANGTTAIISPVFDPAFVNYAAGTPTAIDATKSVKYIGLWTSTATPQQAWATVQAKTASETPTAAEIADATYAGADPAQVLKQGVARTAIRSRKENPARRHAMRLGRLIVVALVVAACAGAHARDVRPKPRKPTGHPTMHIRISTTGATHALDHTIPIAVSIANDSDQALTLDDPATSLSVEYHQIDHRTKEDLSHAMGKVTATNFGPDQYALVVPVPKQVVIAPHASLTFHTDPNERLYLRPGSFDAFVTLNDTKSNTIALTIAFTRDSVEPLLTLARDPKQEYGRREWAMDWLAKLYPAFRLQLPTPDASAASRTKMEAENQAVYDAFGAWWHEHEHSPGIDQTLSEIR